MFSVRERLALLGGSLSIVSDATGSHISVRAPLAYRFEEVLINQGRYSAMEKTDPEVVMA